MSDMLLSNDQTTKNSSEVEVSELVQNEARKVEDGDQWESDWLDRLLRCGPGGPRNRAFAGFLLLRILFAVVITHSGVVYAGVLTYQAMEFTNCLDDDGGGDSCGDGDDNVENDSVQSCRRLFGILKPDSLLTVLATGAAFVVALTSIFVGAFMDVTPFRKQIGLFFACLSIAGDLLCLAIVGPGESSLAIASFGLFITFLSKNYQFMLLESYPPELSHKHDEVSRALSVGGVWMYVTQVATVLLWILISFIGFIDATYGFVVTVGTIILLSILIPAAFTRLPNTPARHAEELKTQSLLQYSFSRQKMIFLDLYHNHKNLGIYYFSNAIFDPALVALFVAAIQVLVSKFHFSSDQIPIIIGVAIVSAAFGALIPRYIVIYYRRKHEKLKSTSDSSDYEPLLDAVHPTVYKYLIIADLILLGGVTSVAVYYMQPCNVGLACVFAVMWGFCLAFCWTCGSIMRSALVPGGSESEYAGFLLTSTTATSWIPLFVFSIANEVWTIDGAMLTLVGFYLIGSILLQVVFS